MYIFVTDESRTAEVKRFLAEKTRLNPAAFHVRYLAEISKNEVGKTLYAELEKYYD